MYELCHDYVSRRISTAQNTIDAAQSSANEETKSSAGDKYETGRSMMQQEAEWARRQLEEARKLKMEMDQIKLEESESPVHNGCLVYTSKGIFYISISAGKLVVDDETAFAISAASPLGTKLLGLQPNDSFDLNGQSFKILKVA